MYRYKLYRTKHFNVLVPSLITLRKLQHMALERLYLHPSLLHYWSY